MSESRKAMATWVGVLARGGILKSPTEEKGVFVAIEVVGESRLSELRQWVRRQERAVRDRERRAAIEVCIWMAHADRKLTAEEHGLLEEIIESSELGEDETRQLTEAIDEPPSLDDVDTRLTHPVLRELMLALAWELAAADGTLDPLEKDFHGGLAEKLCVDGDRAATIRRAVTNRVTAPPG